MAFFLYSYSETICGVRESIAVLHHFSNGGEESSLQEIADDLTNRRLSPTRILLICGKGSEDKIQILFENFSQSTKDRLSILSHIDLAVYGINGELLQEDSQCLYGDNSNWNIDEKTFLKILEQGMACLIEQTGVIMRAPAGFIFRKPSNATHHTFIRAGNIFKDPSGLGLISHFLMRHIPVETITIYIDSFTILSAVLFFQKERRHIATKLNIDYTEPTISNFHSYSKNRNLVFPAHEKYRILISASTSGVLASELAKDHGANKKLIHHLLFFPTAPNDHWNNIYTQKEHKIEKEDDKSCKVISIPGEEFIVSHGDTSPVSITKKHFASKNGNLFKEPFYSSALKLNLSSPGHQSYTLFDIDETKENFPSDFVEWVEEVCRARIPASTACIVSTTNQSAFASLIASKLKPHLNKEIPIFAEKDINKIDVPNGTILLAEFDVKNGEELLSISRRLRDIPHGHRVYFLGHHFSETLKSHKRLKSNLCVSGKGVEYGWIVYKMIPIGRKIGHSSWLIEREKLTDTSEGEINNRTLDDIIRRRIQALNGGQLSADNLFLPKINAEPLAIRSDSILFTESYDQNKISQAIIYLLVSAAIQRAREGIDAEEKYFPPGEYFTGNLFEPSVLNPNMFSRFNDGVIQASLLRACTPDELNYSGDQQLSLEMLEILRLAIEHPETATGEAILEMMLALSTKRLRLTDEHFKEAKDSLKSSEKLAKIWNLLESDLPF